MTFYRRNLPSGIQIYSKNLGVTSKFQMPEDWYVVSYWRPTILVWHVGFTVIWCFLLSVCAVIHIFICKEKNCNYCGENMRCHCTKFSHLGDQAPEICATCYHIYTSWWWHMFSIWWFLFLIRNFQLQNLQNKSKTYFSLDLKMLLIHTTLAQEYKSAKGCNPSLIYR